MDTVFSYRLPGRRPMTLFASAFATALLGLAAYHSAPWYIWVIWLAAAGALYYLVLWNPMYGLDLTATSITLSPDLRPVTFALGDIDTVILTDGSDSDSAAIKLRDGSHHQVFCGDLPPLDAFQAELAARGVAVLRR